MKSVLFFSCLNFFFRFNFSRLDSLKKTISKIYLIIIWQVFAHIKFKYLAKLSKISKGNK